MSAPARLIIRTYNVGFGDCFLLRFDYGTFERRVLIDYGSTAAPDRAGHDYMKQVALDIAKQCRNADGGATLDAVVATHRHRDHISGFATDGIGTGKLIANLKPKLVIQPWTEDPRTQPDARTATSTFYSQGKPTPAALRKQYVATLEDMHRVAATAAREAVADSALGVRTRAQLAFLGDDNGLPNRSAIANLTAMGTRARSAYVHCGSPSGLETILPGVKTHVLGPPDLRQSEAIRRQRASDPDEFWHFAFAEYRSFWRAQALAGGAARRGAGARPLFPHAATWNEDEVPANLRWFVGRARRLRGSQLLEIVRELDTVMNNTSVILLFRVGGESVLFPGDAQIENWAYALGRPEYRELLRETTIYKVGHHGSLNATPKSLWEMFAHKHEAGAEGTRLRSLLSTKSGKHGSTAQNTEVPRRTLVAELEKESDLFSTQKMRKAKIGHDLEIQFAKEQEND